MKALSVPQNASLNRTCSNAKHCSVTMSNNSTALESLLFSISLTMLSRFQIPSGSLPLNIDSIKITKYSLASERVKLRKHWSAARR